MTKSIDNRITRHDTSNVDTTRVMCCKLKQTELFNEVMQKVLSPAPGKLRSRDTGAIYYVAYYGRT